VVNEPDTLGRPPCTTAIGPEGALLGAIDLVRIDKAHKVRDTRTEEVIATGRR
jgi:hypothetical protein